MRWNFYSLLLITVLNAVEVKADNSCVMYGNINYTRCLQPVSQVVRSGMTEQQKMSILNYQNHKRMEASGTKMVKLYWNKTLERLAQKWSDQCSTAHDYRKARQVKEWGNPIGQNIGFGLPDPLELAKLWFEEKNIWEKGERREPAIGHYTQMMHEWAALVGCGFTECQGKEYYLVCNYGIGQPLTSINTPYHTGQACQHCQDTCENGVCDCHGRMCWHYGKMNLNTCNCDCYPNFHGDLCQLKSCNSTDEPLCSALPKSRMRYICNKYANIYVGCPFLCGLCP